MAKAGFLELDNLDDRREVWTLLSNLHPRKRIRFMDWCANHCCYKTTNINGKPEKESNPFIMAPSKRTREYAERAIIDETADIQLIWDLYFDFWALCTQYGLDYQTALSRLVDMVRREHKGRSLSSIRSGGWI